MCVCGRQAVSRHSGTLRFLGPRLRKFPHRKEPSRSERASLQVIIPLLASEEAYKGQRELARGRGPGSSGWRPSPVRSRMSGLGNGQRQWFSTSLCWPRLETEHLFPA